MSNIPLLSIIIAVYKAEKTLVRCLDSIFHQISPDGDEGIVEVLAVDDASPDGSGAILSEYRKSHSALRIVSHSENRRESGSRNTGVVESRGEYYTFLDPDDTYAPNAIERILSTIRFHHPDLIHYCYERVSPDGAFLSRTHFSSPGLHSTNPDGDVELQAVFQETAFGIMTSGGVYRRAIAPELRFSHDFPISPDRHFGWEFFRRCRNVFQIDAPLYEYYQYPDTLSRVRSDAAVKGLLRLDCIFWKEFHEHSAFSKGAQFGFRRLFPGVVGWHLDIVFGKSAHKKHLAPLYFDALNAYLGKTAKSELGAGYRWLKWAVALQSPVMVRLFRTWVFHFWRPGIRKLTGLATKVLPMKMDFSKKLT